MVCGLKSVYNLWSTIVGSTTDKFCFRWNNYKKIDRKALKAEKHMQPEIYEHLAAGDNNCFFNDYSIILIEKMVQISREEKCTGEKF